MRIIEFFFCWDDGVGFYRFLDSLGCVIKGVIGCLEMGWRGRVLELCVYFCSWFVYRFEFRVMEESFLLFRLELRYRYYRSVSSILLRF